MSYDGPARRGPGDIASNPTQELTYELGPAAPRKVKVMTDEQADKVIKAAPPEWQPLLTFLLQTGVRISEALGLVWGDLDLASDKPEVRVRRQRYEGVVKELKTPNSVREVPLSRGMVATLLQLRMALGRPPDDAPVWCLMLGPAGRKRYVPLEAHNLRTRLMRPLARKVGLPWVGFHTFRHTCASTLFAHGKSIKQVQHWLGHADATFTLRTYVHLQDGDLGGADLWDTAAAQLASRV